MEHIILKNKKMQMEFNPENGAIYSLKGMLAEKSIEFLLNPSDFSEMNTERARWLGCLALSVIKGEKYHFWTGEWIKNSIVEQDESKIKIQYLGIKGFLNVTEQYHITDENVRWTITIQNSGEEAAKIDRMQIPLPMNQFFCKDDEYKYEQCVLRHSCLCGSNAWIYWQRSCGIGPILAMKAMNKTQLDYFEIEEEKPFGNVCESGRAFEGIYSVFPYYQKGEMTAGNERTAVINPGEELEVELLFTMLDNLKDIKDWLSRQDGFLAEVRPGMVLPKGKRAELRIYSKKIPLVRMSNKEDVCGEIKCDQDCFRTEICLNGYGRRKMTVRFGNQESELVLFGIEQIKEIYKSQARFITENQFETEETDPCYHGILMWDMTRRQRVNSSYESNIPDWYAGGSDEIGLVSGLFLSELNKYYPNKGQIKILKLYCEDFLEQRLTEMPGYKIHRMVPWFMMFDDWKGYGADDIWRAFNYVHVLNTYFNMYQIAKLYGYDFLRKPTYYLKKVYYYTKAMFSYWMFPNGVGATEYGNMGEHVLALDILSAFRKEGMFDEADEIEKYINAKADFYAGKKYPYGSEMAYDSTAYEAVYAYGKVRQDNRVMQGTVQVAMANRGIQPVWYLDHTDLRQMGESTWNVSYMTQLGAWVFYDWGLEQKHYDIGLLRGWYASYLAGFSIYNSGGYWSQAKENEGASTWIIHGKYGETSNINHGDPIRKGAVALSGESALGFYGALKIAASVVMTTFEGEEVCLGCETGEFPNVYYPTDGLHMRFFNIKDGWAVKLYRDGINRIVCQEDEIELQIENRTKDEHELILVFRTEYPGLYRFICGKTEIRAEVVGEWTNIQMRMTDNIVKIRRE